MTDNHISRTTEQPERPAALLPYLPGLDGLRALAVLGVLFYHADLGLWGGFLGVESFFVLSGFLITGLLFAEWRRDGRIDLRAFWSRRARRLLPALFLMLAGTLVLTAILLPDELADLSRDTLAALVYGTNWYLIASQQSYFDVGERPSLLQHLWSLAIEEQFYVLWPLICAAGMRFLRVRGFLVLIVASAAASVALMIALYDPGADPSRIYYGTDTRASALLLGAAMALVWSPPQASAITRGKRWVILDSIGILALIGLIAAYVSLHEQHPLLYRGGFGVVAIGTAVVIAVATHPAARVTQRLLEWQPLRWVGLRSYGIYLWHWPIFMITRPGLDVAYDGWLLQVLRFALAFALAALSYSFVELPIRRGGWSGIWQALGQLKERGAAIRAMIADRTARADQRLTAEAVVSPQGAPSRRQVARPQKMLYRRWVRVIAATGLLLGGTSLAASVTQAMRQNSLILPSTPAAARTAALPTPTAGKTGAGAVAAAPVESTPATSPVAAPTTSAAASAPTPTAATEQSFDPALASELQRVLDATVADGAIPGAVLSVRLSDGTTWTGASGLADREAGVVMQADTRVRIGSLTKMFTAVVVLQLAEEGIISLDTPVDAWLPNLLPAGDAITVRHLLQHTSGLYDYLEDRRFARRAHQEPERVWNSQELVAYAIEFPLAFNPGARNSWDYSNTNYVVLGMLVERVTGNPLGEEMRRRIFEPLALQHTTFVLENAVDERLAHGYSKGDDQTNVAMSFAFATANIVTTADDLRRFGDALFAGQLLKPETRDQMYQFVNGKGKYGMPELEYGLGLMRNRLPVDPSANQTRSAEASRVVGHIGGFSGFRAALWYAPESQLLITLSVNQSSTDPNELATQVFEVLLAQQGR